MKLVPPGNDLLGWGFIPSSERGGGLGTPVVSLHPTFYAHSTPGVLLFPVLALPLTRPPICPSYPSLFPCPYPKPVPWPAPSLPPGPHLCPCPQHDPHVLDKEVEVARFGVPAKLEEKHEESELLKAIYRDLPATAMTTTKLGDVRTVQFYDNDIISWNVPSLNVRQSVELGAPNVIGRWFLVACDFKVVVACLEAPSQVLELSGAQLDGRNITALSPLYSVPVFAVGCSDGFIRLWNYEANIVSSAKLTVPGGKQVTPTPNARSTPSALNQRSPRLCVLGGGMHGMPLVPDTGGCTTYDGADQWICLSVGTPHKPLDRGSGPSLLMHAVCCARKKVQQWVPPISPGLIYSSLAALGIWVFHRGLKQAV